jgi:hypothetical protein
LAETSCVGAACWVTTWRNVSVGSRANWKQLPVVRSVTFWISAGAVGSWAMSKTEMLESAVLLA